MAARIPQTHMGSDPLTEAVVLYLQEMSLCRCSDGRKNKSYWRGCTLSPEAVFDNRENQMLAIDHQSIGLSNFTADAFPQYTLNISLFNRKQR